MASLKRAGGLVSFSLYLDVENLRRFVRRDRDQRLSAFSLATARFPSINRQPARIDDDLAVGLERSPLDPRDAGRHLKLRRRIEHRDEAPHDHVVDLLLHFIEALRRPCRSG